MAIETRLCKLKSHCRSALSAAVAAKTSYPASPASQAPYPSLQIQRLLIAGDHRTID